MATFSNYNDVNTQKQLWKVGTFNRRTFYQVDGTGRDTYINRNNGNFVTDREPNVNPISGRYM